MKISVSSYSFYQYVRAGKLTLVELPKLAHDIGFDAIEFIDIPGETQEEKLALAAQIKAEADALGMEINAYTIGACLYQETDEASDKEVARLVDQLDVAVALGAKVMRHDVVYALGKTGAARSFDGMLPTIAKNAQRVADEAAKRGITTCTENHGYISQDSDRVERLFNAVNRDNFGILVDIGNFVCVDEDNVTAVSRLAPYAVHVHAKDFFIQEFGTRPEGWGTTRGRRYFCGCVLGEGVVPVRQCIDIVRAAGYDGYFSLEYEGKIDCIEGIKRGYAFLRSIDG